MGIVKKLDSGIRLGANLIFVSNVTKSKKWYEAVLGMTSVEFRPPEFLEMKLGANRFYIETSSNNRAAGFRRARIGVRTSIVFAVDNIELTIRKMKRQRVRVIVEPVQQFWGGWNAIISDPDGNEFILDQDK